MKLQIQKLELFFYLGSEQLKVLPLLFEYGKNGFSHVAAQITLFKIWGNYNIFRVFEFLGFLRQYREENILMNMNVTMVTMLFHIILDDYISHIF